jgi:formate C-acetyltransferase
VGVPNVVDSLYAINKLVFEDKEFTVTQYKKILDDNFNGNEELRLRILNKLPKYGNDNDEIDCYFEKITGFIIEECKKYTPVFSNGRLIPSVFCWIQHERFGRNTGATPDGRVAFFPLADGSGPCQGRESCGPTASILSSTKWSHAEMLGGVAVNMKFSKSSFTSDSCNNMLALIKTYLQRGGFELQINVTDKATLEKARDNPEEYKDLVVRIGGYSDYFTNISPQMQAEVILRTEHEI